MPHPDRTEGDAVTEEQAKHFMLVGCHVVYRGITYKCIKELAIAYDRHAHKFVLYLWLEDMRANSITRALADRCIPIPL